MLAELARSWRPARGPKIVGAMVLAVLVWAGCEKLEVSPDTPTETPPGAEPAKREGASIGVASMPIAAAIAAKNELDTVALTGSTTSDYFGNSLALHADELLVGAPTRPGTGSAYHYHFDGAGWQRVFELQPSDASAAQDFGWSLALSASHSLVGARARANGGAVYVFARNAASFSEEAVLTAADTAPGDEFGFAVALSGQRALVGAPGHGLGGAAYLFIRNASAWQQEAKLVASDNHAGSEFATSVSLDGDRALVGAYGQRIAAVRTGAAYLFERNAASWPEKAKLVGDGGGYTDFGWAISLVGDRAIVGADSEDLPTALGGGVVHVFARNAETWSREAKIAPDDSRVYQGFGISLDFDGSRLVVGASADFSAASEAGSAYVFEHGQAGWQQQAKLVASDGEQYDRLGMTVAAHGRHAAAASYRNEVVYLYGIDSPGAACSAAAKCLSGFCESGVCCASVCGGACERCDLASTMGACTVTPLSGEGSPSCHPLVCDGRGTSCPERCHSNGSCAAGFFCDGDSCQPRFELGESCSTHGQCTSAHCVDGVCCDGACDGSCDRCDFSLSAGRCSLVEAGGESDGSCHPLRCDGKSAGCPEGCEDARGCAPTHYCEGRGCVEKSELGQACDGSQACQSAQCTDGLCCIAADCAPYRCGPGGACHTSCTSTGQCASGNVCASDESCRPASDAPAASESGACSISAVPGDSRWGLAMLLMVQLRPFWRRRRKRRAATESGASAVPQMKLSGCQKRRVKRGVLALLSATLGLACGPDREVDRRSGSSSPPDPGLVNASSQPRVTATAGSALQAYPLSSLPLIYAESAALIAEGSQGGEGVGRAISLDGERVLVGAPYERGAGTFVGAAYVFARTADGWQQEGRLAASDGVDRDYFGWSVALSGDVALVGALGNDERADSAGAVYSFLRTAAGWQQEAKLLAGDGQASDNFGVSVSLDGDTALIGANGSAARYTWGGAAYVLLRSANAWAEQAKLLPSSAEPSQFFGFSVAVDGDRALVGAFGDDEVARDGGAAYTFVRTATSWTEEEKIMPSDGVLYDYFGESVDLAGDRAIFGARFHDESGPNTGAAYIFKLGASGWSEAAKLLPAQSEDYGEFATAVSIMGTHALVGHPNSSRRGIYGGAAYLFVERANGWEETAIFLASNGETGAAVGRAVSIGPYDAAIGAPWGTAADNYEGAAYVVSAVSRGEACRLAEDCVEGNCVDGVCCSSVCGDPCERCDLASSPGTCAPAPAGTPGRISCGAYICDGRAGTCPIACDGDEQCAAGHHCADGGCVPVEANGTVCDRGRSCESGQCVGGICCSAACDGGCARCDLAGRRGSCELLASGVTGDESCGPYLCDGVEASCAEQCVEHKACAEGFYCLSGSCAPRVDLGQACTEAATCLGGHCTDGLCCTAESCEPYRCGPAGTCRTSCISSSECAAGYTCLSSRKCVPVEPSVSSNEQSGCSVSTGKGSSSGAGKGSSSGAGSSAWLWVLALSWLRARKHRSEAAA